MMAELRLQREVRGLDVHMYLISCVFSSLSLQLENPESIYFPFASIFRWNFWQCFYLLTHNQIWLGFISQQCHCHKFIRSKNENDQIIIQHTNICMNVRMSWAKFIFSETQMAANTKSETQEYARSYT